MWDYISSKPAIGIFDVNGAFDSHTLPPVVFNASRSVDSRVSVWPSRLVWRRCDEDVISRRWLLIEDCGYESMPSRDEFLASSLPALFE